MTLIDRDKIKYSYLPLAVLTDRFVTETDILKLRVEDAEPVIHAHWEKTAWQRGDLWEYRCSNCRKNHKRTHIWKKKYQKLPNYCEKCGSKMNKYRYRYRYK